jgi:hypothetical protein
MFIFSLAVSAKSYGEVKELSLSSEGISAMEIECGAGDLWLKEKAFMLILCLVPSALFILPHINLILFYAQCNYPFRA